MQEFIARLPSVGTLPGFLLYSVFAYIISFSLSLCMSRFVAANIDIEAGVKKTIHNKRKEQDAKKDLVKNIMEACR